MTVQQIDLAIAARRLTADSIRDLAYILDSRHRQSSDFGATMIGRRLSRGSLLDGEAVFLCENFDKLMMATIDEIEAI